MRSVEQPNAVRTIDRMAMFLIGTINNLPYVICIAGAKRIVEQYHEPTYLGLVFWANTFNGLFARFLNTWMLSINIRHEVGFVINCISMLFGLIGCAFSKNFWFTLVCIFFVGFSSNFGEAVQLCYMTHRRKQVLLKSWSSGTGMAGIIGAGYSLICDLVDVPYFWSFIGVSPVVVIYFFAFFCVIVPSPEEEEDKFEKPLITSEISEVQENYEQNDQKVSIWDFSILKTVSWYIFNCGAVYFLEYIIQGAYAHCALTKEETKKYKYMYSLLNLMYQVGVFISRSSLSLFKFPWVGTLTGIQTVFFVMWLFQALYHYMTVVFILILMVFVGLLGGCSYVNVFHLIMNEPTLSKKEKEMATSWNSFFISLWIVLAAVFTTISESTYLKDQLK